MDVSSTTTTTKRRTVQTWGKKGRNDISLNETINTNRDVALGNWQLSLLRLLAIPVY